MLLVSEKLIALNCFGNSSCGRWYSFPNLHAERKTTSNSNIMDDLLYLLCIVNSSIYSLQKIILPPVGFQPPWFFLLSFRAGIERLQTVQG